MDYIKILKADLEKGYSKSDLEKLIGLPKNNLSGILKGDKKLSAKSRLKIDIWEKTVKPSPLKLFFKKPENEQEKHIQDLTEGTNKVKDLTKKPPTTNYVTDTRKPFMSDAIKKKLGIKD
jgi:transcriptional regulator with XRE-family HTH domain